MRLLVITIAFALGFGLGVYYGFMRVPTEFDQWNAQFEASLLVFELEQLKSGELDQIIGLKEQDLDFELVKHARYLDSSFMPIFPIAYDYQFDPKYITQAVEYRLQNPYSGRDMTDSANWRPGTDMNSPEMQELLSAFTDNKEQLERVLREYGGE